jgi:hypothetical protein
MTPLSGNEAQDLYGAWTSQDQAVEGVDSRVNLEEGIPEALPRNNPPARPRPLVGRVSDRFCNIRTVGISLCAGAVLGAGAIVMSSIDVDPPAQMLAIYVLGGIAGLSFCCACISSMTMSCSIRR